MSWKRISQASLKYRLLGWLLPTMALVTLASLWLTRTDALASANSAYDRSLLGAIKSLDLNVSTASGGVSVELPYRLFEFFQLTTSGQVYFRVATADGLVEIGNPDLPTPSQPLASGVPTFYDAIYFGEPVRIGALMRPLHPPHTSANAPQLIIQVAESTQSREKFTSDLLRRAAWRELALLLIMVCAVIWGLMLALRPLTRLARETQARAPDDVQALPTHGLPQDLTPLVNAVNQQLQRTQELMSARRTFIDDASHQLRTPLAVLRTQLDYALRTTDPEEQKTALHALSKELGHAIRATNQLLTLGKTDAATIDQDHFDLNQLGRDVALALLPLAQLKHVDFGVDAGETPVPARGDRHLLQQAWANIAHNAIQHGKAHGVVTLAAHADACFFYMQVMDNGDSMPAEVRTRIGQRFLKSKDSPGSGLGLAIAHAVITRHGGRLDITPAHPGPGNCVTLKWPRT